MISYSLVRFDFRLSDLLHLECVGEEVWAPPGEGASGKGDTGEGQSGENEAPVLGERPQVLRVGGSSLTLLTLRQTLGGAPVHKGQVWSLTQLHSVWLLTIKDLVWKKCVFNKHTIKVCVKCF